jgi:osmotically-inducible protein OsmY
MMAAEARKDVVWDAAAGRDPRREALDLEAAIAAALARNTGLRHHHIAVTAGPDGLVTLTGTVSTQSLRREVELACWTVSGVRSLHDNLIVGR